jgi:hypothetical protein
MLQVGGVQEPIMVAPPPVEDPVATPPVTLTEPELDELHVSGIPVICNPSVSKIVGVIVLEVLDEVVTASVIDCTGQVVKYIGTLLTLPIVAKRGVRPGVLAVTSTWPGSKRLSAAVSVATLATRVCQVKTPTVEVISTPLLYAVA